MKSKPKGSGYYAIFWGLLFALALLVSSRRTAMWLTGHPEWIIRAWLFVVSATLLLWGIGRLRTATESWVVGQETINFVMGAIAATLALLALFH